MGWDRIKIRIRWEGVRDGIGMVRGEVGRIRDRDRWKGLGMGIGSE